MGVGGLGASSLTMLWGISDAGSMKPLDSIDPSQHVAVPRSNADFALCARAHALAGDASSLRFELVMWLDEKIWPQIPKPARGV